MKKTPTAQENTLTASLQRLSGPQSAGLAFSACACLSLLLSFLFVVILSLCGATVEQDNKPDWYLYCSYLLPQLAFFAVAFFGFFLVKIPVRETVGKVRVKYILLAVLLQFGLFSLSYINDFFVRFLQTFGYTPSAVQIPSTDGFGLVGVLFVVAVMPALLEEIIFRGFLLRGLKGFGGVFSVFVCGGLFALYHQNPVQTAYQFCCGAAFALLALRAGGILPTVIAHLLNNAAIVLYYHFTGLDALPLPLPVIIAAAVCLVTTLVYLVWFDKGEASRKEKGKRGFFAFAAIGLIICTVSWIAALFA